MRITYCRKKRVKPYMGNKKEMCDKNYERTLKRQRWREVSPFGPCRVIWTTFSRKKSVIRVSNNLHVRFRRLSIYLWETERENFSFNFLFLVKCTKQRKLKFKNIQPLLPDNKERYKLKSKKEIKNTLKCFVQLLILKIINLETSVNNWKHTFFT